MCLVAGWKWVGMDSTHFDPRLVVKGGGLGPTKSRYIPLRSGLGWSVQIERTTPTHLHARLRSVTRGRRGASGARSWWRRAVGVGAGGGASAAGSGRRRVPGAAAGGGAAAAGSGRSRGCGCWEQQERRRRSSARRRGPRRCAVRGAGREEDEGVC